MVSDQDADYHRYLALLRDADDEPKRLALIQLLINEGARERVAAKSKVVDAELAILQPLTFNSELPLMSTEAQAEWSEEPTVKSEPQNAQHLSVAQVRESFSAPMVPSEVTLRGAAAPVLFDTDDLVEGVTKLLESRSYLPEAPSDAAAASNPAISPHGSDPLDSIASQILAMLAKRDGH
jgi:hypothetical protein